MTFKDNLVEIPKKLDLRPYPSHLLTLPSIILPRIIITTLNSPNHMSIQVGDLGYLSNRLLLIIHPLPLRYKFEVSTLRPPTKLDKLTSIRGTKVHIRSPKE
jgi:hypothetical protein